MRPNTQSEEYLGRSFGPDMAIHLTSRILGTTQLRQDRTVARTFNNRLSPRIQ